MSQESLSGRHLVRKVVAWLIVALLVVLAFAFTSCAPQPYRQHQRRVRHELKHTVRHRPLAPKPQWKRRF